MSRIINEVTDVISNAKLRLFLENSTKKLTNDCGNKEKVVILRRHYKIRAILPLARIIVKF